MDCMFRTKKGEVYCLFVYVLLSCVLWPYLISCVTSYVIFLYMCMHNSVGQLPIHFSVDFMNVTGLILSACEATTVLN